jgi:hypothetical protein
MKRYEPHEIPQQERRSKEDDRSEERRRRSRSSSFLDVVKDEYSAATAAFAAAKEAYQERKAEERAERSRSLSVSDRSRSSSRSQERRKPAPAKNLQEAKAGAERYLQRLIDDPSDEEWKADVHKALKSLMNNDCDQALHHLLIVDKLQQIAGASKEEQGRRWRAEDYVAQARSFRRKKEEGELDGTPQELPAHFPQETSPQGWEKGTGPLADAQYNNPESR